MARPKHVAGAVDTADRLIAAAEDEFARVGYEGAKLQSIAEAAGISRPSLLYHFKSKHELYCAVVQSVFTSMGASLATALSGEGSFSKQLDGVLTSFTRFLETRPTAARLVLREVLDGRGPGQDLLIEAGVPLLRLVERFIRDQGKGVVREDVPVKDALLQMVAGAFVKASSSPLIGNLWEEEDTTPALARILFLGGKA